MNLAELTKLAKKPESATLEFKRSTAELDRAVETLVAFLNAKGGTVLIGVRGNGSADGIEVSDKTRQQVAGAVRQIEPPADIDIEYVDVAPRHTVIVLTCAPGSQVPYTLDGRAWVRIDNTTRRMKVEEYEMRLLQRLHAYRRWDNRPADGYTLKDLDLDEVIKVRDLAVNANRLTSRASRDPADILNRLGVLSPEGVPFQAALVLFGTRLLSDYPQCSVRLARFKGATKREFLDSHQTAGHAFQLLDLAAEFVGKHMLVPGRIVPGRLRREDRPQYPPEAVREALVNALVHRDYSQAGGAVSVAMFDDRLEVASTGRLPAGITVDELKRTHRSVPRNPIIADVFHRCGLIERWGRGTQTILELCHDAGCPEPVFEEEAGDVVVRFFPATAPTSIDQIPRDVSRRQVKVLDALRVSGAQTATQLHRALGLTVTERTLRADLEALIQRGLVEKFGKARATRYRLSPGAGGRS